MVLLAPHSSGVIIYVFHDVQCTLLQFIHWVVVIWAIVLFWIAVIIHYIAIIPWVFFKLNPITIVRGLSIAFIPFLCVKQCSLNNASCIYFHYTVLIMTCTM